VELATPADPGAGLPHGTALGDWDGVVWTGSSLSLAKPDDPPVRRQLELARAAAEAGVPAFGSCFAAQLAAVACAPHPRGREFGIAREIRLSAEGRRHPLFRGKPACFAGFASHGDHVTGLPSGAPALASNAWSPVQALAVGTDGSRGSFWAVQYHPEYDLREMARLALLRGDELVAQGHFAGPAEVQAWVRDMEALHADPSREDLRDRLGLDATLLDPALREVEVGNWLAHAAAERTRR